MTTQLTRCGALVLALAFSASSAWAKPRRTVEQRLEGLANTLRCGEVDAPDDPKRHVACLVALHWAEAKADPLPTGDTALVGGTVEFPDERGADWHIETIPAVGGIHAQGKSARICENDMFADSVEAKDAIAAMKAPLQVAFATLTAPLVVPPLVERWARERAAHAPSPLVKRGESWTTRFQGAVELRHLDKRWFLVETRRGDSGLWISAFTADFSVAR